MALIAENRVDYLGLNFYHPKRVKAPDAIPVISPSWSPEWYYDAYLMPGRRMNVDKGWKSILRLSMILLSRCETITTISLGSYLKMV